MLNPDLTTVIFQIINFLVLTGLLYLLFFRPVMRKVRARVAEKENLMARTAEDQAEAARLRQAAEQRLRDLDDETARVISEARERAETERAAVLSQAQNEVQHLLVEAQMDAYRMRGQTLDQFHDELLDTILAISGQAIERVAPAELHETMVRQLNQRIRELGSHETARVENFRRSLGGRTPTVTITSARPLSPELQGLLVRTFSALADRTPRLELRTDPALALGVRARVGDLMVDNTIARHLDELRNSVSQSLREQLDDGSTT